MKTTSAKRDPAAPGEGADTTYKVKKAIRDASKKLPVRTYLNIMRIQERLVDEMQNLHRANGLTQAQFNVLRIVYCVGGQGVPCKDIGERLVNRDPDVTGLIDRLSAAGWVERVRDTEDRRRVLVHLTDAGRDLIERTTPALVRRHYAQFAHLSGAELEELNHLLVKARSDRPETSARR